MACTYLGPPFLFEKDQIIIQFFSLITLSTIVQDTEVNAGPRGPGPSWLQQVLFSGTTGLCPPTNWLIADDRDAAMVLKSALVGSNEGLKCLLYRGIQMPHMFTGSMKRTKGPGTWLIKCSLDWTKVFLYIYLCGWIPAILISCLFPVLWAAKLVKMLGNTVFQGKLMTFEQLKDKFVQNFFIKFW